LDFKSAYNTIPHKELFEKLNCALSGKEIQLLKAIYTRLKIRLGNESIRYNNGVAQGNMISPVLFDIYAEDLLWNSVTKAGTSKAYWPMPMIISSFAILLRNLKEQFN